MNRRIWFVLACLCVSSGCTSRRPPTGTPVTLTETERAGSPSFGSKRAWFAWEKKGEELEMAGRHAEALYCFHQALPLWPKTISPEEAEEAARRAGAPGAPIEHLPVPIDTLLHLADVYLELGEERWARHYLEELSKYEPEGFSRRVRARLEERSAQSRN